MRIIGSKTSISELINNGLHRIYDSFIINEDEQITILKKENEGTVNRYTLITEESYLFNYKWDRTIILYR